MELKDITALVIGGVILIGIIIYLAVNQKKKIVEWLKYAVAESEKILGSGTGQLKLRLVYDWFCRHFGIISAVVPFKVFSAWVDTALETLDRWLETNIDITGYVGVIGKKHGGENVANISEK